MCSSFLLFSVLTLQAVTATHLPTHHFYRLCQLNRLPQLQHRLDHFASLQWSRVLCLLLQFCSRSNWSKPGKGAESVSSSECYHCSGIMLLLLLAAFYFVSIVVGSLRMWPRWVALKRKLHTSETHIKAFLQKNLWNVKGGVEHTHIFKISKLGLLKNLGLATVGFCCWLAVEFVPEVKKSN